MFGGFIHLLRYILYYHVHVSVDKASFVGFRLLERILYVLVYFIFYFSQRELSSLVLSNTQLGGSDKLSQRKSSSFVVVVVVGLKIGLVWAG